MTKIDWSHFPDPETSKKIINTSLRYQGSRKKDEKGEYRPPTPYHFTLFIMFALYCHLQGAIRIKEGHATDYIQLGCDNDDDSHPYLKDIAKSGQAPIPEYKEARNKSFLRAIAFFSWEKERRAFLTRRVYPTYFDFLSYSHVPEGWGALGVMLKDFLQNEDRVYTEVPDLRSSKTFVPYLREVKRLKYDSIIVIPVIKSNRFDIADLLGAFAFYLKDKSCLPVLKEKSEVQNRFRAFARQMGGALIKHEKSITRGSYPLVKLLNDEYPVRNKTEDGKALMELTIKLPPTREQKYLDEAITSIMRVFGGNEYFSILDVKDKSHRTRSIFLVGREETDGEKLKKQVYEVVGSIHLKMPFIKFDYNFRHKKRKSL